MKPVLLVVVLKLPQLFVAKVCRAFPVTFPEHTHNLATAPGSAIFCLLSQHMTVILQRLEVPIPRKLAANSSVHEKVLRSQCRTRCIICLPDYQGLAKFYSSLYTSFLRHIPYSNPSIRAIVIASPGWVRDTVFDHLMAEANRTGNKALLTARNKFIKVHVNSAHVHSLTEVLRSPEVRLRHSMQWLEVYSDTSDCVTTKGDQVCPRRHYAR